MLGWQPGLRIDQGSHAGPLAFRLQTPGAGEVLQPNLGTQAGDIGPGSGVVQPGEVSSQARAQGTRIEDLAQAGYRLGLLVRLSVLTQDFECPRQAVVRPP